MREFKYGVGVIAPNFLLNLLLVKMSEKSSTKADFRGKNKKDMSDDGTVHCHVSGPPKRHCYVYFAALDLIWKCNYVIVLKFSPLRSIYVNFNPIGKLFYK